MVNIAVAISRFLNQKDQSFLDLNDIDFSQVTEESMRILIDFLGSHKTIKTIYMERCHLSELSVENAHLLFGQLNSTDNVVALKLATNALGTNSVVLNCLAKLVRIREIAELDLSANKIDDAEEMGINALCSIIAEGKIKKLQLESNQLHKISTRLLAQLFSAIGQNNRHLESLDFSSNDLGLLSSELFKVLLTNILANKFLKYLDISVNYLIALDTSNTRVVSDFLEHILLNEQLIDLRISGNNLYLLGASWLLGFIKNIIRSDNLTSVDISANSLASLLDEDKDFISNLAKAIGGSGGVKRIVIRNNGFLAEDERQLTELLKLNGESQSSEMQDTKLAEQFLEKLRDDPDLFKELINNPAALSLGVRMVEICKTELLKGLGHNSAAVKIVENMLTSLRSSVHVPR